MCWHSQTLNALFRWHRGHYWQSWRLYCPDRSHIYLVLDVYSQRSRIVSFERGFVWRSKTYWSFHSVPRIDRLYVEWPPPASYTEHDPRRAHRDFHHLSANKLLAHLHRSSNMRLHLSCKTIPTGFKRRVLPARGFSSTPFAWESQSRWMIVFSANPFERT